jgi:predicted ATP-dependent serine protease
MSRLDLPPGALVGRDREFGFLQGFFQEAAVSGGAVLLSGEPGVGKTALLNGLADSVSAAGTTVLRGGRGVRGRDQLRRAQPVAVPVAR